MSGLPILISYKIWASHFFICENCFFRIKFNFSICYFTGVVLDFSFDTLTCHFDQPRPFVSMREEARGPHGAEQERGELRPRPHYASLFFYNSISYSVNAVYLFSSVLPNDSAAPFGFWGMGARTSRVWNWGGPSLACTDDATIWSYTMSWFVLQTTSGRGPIKSHKEKPLNFMCSL